MGKLVNRMHSLKENNNNNNNKKSEQQCHHPNKTTKKSKVPSLLSMSSPPRVHVETMISEKSRSRSGDSFNNNNNNNNNNNSPKYIRNIYFSKAQRFDNVGPKNQVQIRKELLEKKAEELREKKNEEIIKRQLEASRIEDEKKALKHEKNKRKIVKRKIKNDIKENTLGISGVYNYHNETVHKALLKPSNVSSIPSRSLSLSQGHDSTGDSNNNINNIGELPLTLELTQEEWEKKRIQTLIKHGIDLTGKGSKRRRGFRNNNNNININNNNKIIGVNQANNNTVGINFSDVSGREAPICFQPPKNQSGDLLYTPKYNQTTREVKLYADVKIDKYAHRPTQNTIIIDRLNKLLTIENLLNIHKKGLKRDIKSLFRTPDDSSDVKDYDICYNKVTREYKPLAPSDDSALHPIIPPKLVMTRRYGKTPDINNYADRDGLLLEAVLGTEKSKYRQRARAELRSEGLL